MIVNDFLFCLILLCIGGWFDGCNLYCVNKGACFLLFLSPCDLDLLPHVQPFMACWLDIVCIFLFH